MSLEEALSKAETALIALLSAKQVGIDDRTGKGNAAESIITDQLLMPHVPSGILLSKGAVVSAEDPAFQSPAIDRVIHDPSLASPLIHTEAHSIFPIEAVVGMVEITMRLDSTKLREDIERMAPIKAMQKRRYLVPVPGTTTKAYATAVDSLSPRSFIVGVPTDPNWSPSTIAASLRSIQLDLGPPTHVHGLYVLGTGFFETVPIETDSDPRYKVRAWTGADRLFRFTSILRQSIDRWPRMPIGWSVRLDDYLLGDSTVMAE